MIMIDKLYNREIKKPSSRLLSLSWIKKPNIIQNQKTWIALWYWQSPLIISKLVRILVIQRQKIKHMTNIKKVTMLHLNLSDWTLSKGMALKWYVFVCLIDVSTGVRLFNRRLDKTQRYARRRGAVLSCLVHWRTSQWISIYLIEL